MSPFSYSLLGAVLAVVGSHELQQRTDVPPPPPALTCQKLTFPPDERAAVARALSKITEVKLDVAAGLVPDRHGLHPHLVTLENKLAAVGAKVGTDGKLRDGQGKLIWIDLRYGSGAQAPPELLRFQEETRKKTHDALQKTHTIVVVDLDPYHIAP